MMVMEPDLARRQRAKTTPEGVALARVLKDIRKDRDLTQQQVADNWGMTVDGYRPWERGQRNVRLDQIADLALALGVTEAELRARLGIAPATEEDLFRQIRALVGADEELWQAIVAEVARFPPDQRAGALRFTLQSLQAARALTVSSQ